MKLPPNPLAHLMPREVRAGTVEAAVQPVEQGISREEVAAAIGELVRAAPICLAAPALWIEGQSRSGAVPVRFDLMERDWGARAAAQARARMDEFVEFGFMTRAQSGQAVTYVLTDLGRSLLRGTFGASAPPSFCGPSERRVVEITSMEWGAFDCGSLRVRFTHIADAWPAWAISEAARARVASLLPPPGQTGQGSISLSRYWVAGARRDAPNGTLRSMCYDPNLARHEGGDLDLHAEPAPVIEAGAPS